MSYLRYLQGEKKSEAPPQILVYTQDTISVLEKCENSNSYFDTI